LPLVETRFLAVVVTLEKQRGGSSISDVRLELRRSDFQLCSLLGCVALPYPPNWQTGFNRPELEPRWGAWEPNLLWMAIIITVALLLISWALLATLYFGVVRLVAFYLNRELNGGGSWRLAAMSLMPGALLLSLGILGYGLGVVDLVRLGFLFPLHFIVGWIYLLMAPLFLPRLRATASLSTNPFTVPPREAKTEPLDEPGRNSR